MASVASGLLLRGVHKVDPAIPLHISTMGFTIYSSAVRITDLQFSRNGCNTVIELFCMLGFNAYSCLESRKIPLLELLNVPSHRVFGGVRRAVGSYDDDLNKVDPTSASLILVAVLHLSYLIEVW